MQKLNDNGFKKVIFQHTINLINQMNLHIHKLHNVEFRKCINQNCVFMVWPHVLKRCSFETIINFQAPSKLIILMIRRHVKERAQNLKIISHYRLYDDNSVTYLENLYVVSLRDSGRSNCRHHRPETFTQKMQIMGTAQKSCLGTKYPWNDKVWHCGLVKKLHKMNCKQLFFSLFLFRIKEVSKHTL